MIHPQMKGKERKLIVFTTKAVFRYLRISILPNSKKSQALTEYGKWLNKTLQELGPIYTKLGQIIATRNDISVEIVKELETLQDRAIAIPFKNISLKLPKNIIEIEDEPIAAASLGIVYRAIWLEDNVRYHVAIKVRRPNIVHELSSNLWGFARVLRRFSDLSEDIEHLLDIARQYRRSIWAELDYVKEAYSIDKLAKGMEPISEWNIVPNIFAANSNFIVMEYIPGVRVTDLVALKKANVDLSAVADNLIQAFLHQCLISDLFHSDPHPGNISVQLSPNIAFIWYDGGSVMECSPEWRNDLVTLSLAILKSDTVAIVTSLEKMEIVKTGRKYRRAVTKFIRVVLSIDNINPVNTNLDSASTIQDINKILDNDPIWREELREAFVSNSKYVLLGKSLLTILAICKTLDPTFSLIPRSMPIIEKFWQGTDVSASINILNEFSSMSKKITQIPSKVAMIEDHLTDLGNDSNDRFQAINETVKNIIIIQTVLLLLFKLV